MAVRELNWKVAGLAGEGIMTTGLLFSKTCTRHGLTIFDYTEYPSLIRGGHNTYQVYARIDETYAQRRNVDVLVALNKNALTFHKDELSTNSLVLFDSEDDKVDISQFDLPGRTFNLPMVRLAQEAGAQRVMANNVALGASVFFLGMDLTVLHSVIDDVFGKKGGEVTALNKNAAKAGYEYAKANGKPLFELETAKPLNQLTMTGNEAIALGAVSAGLQCYVAYPMTPSSSILHYLAAVAKTANIVVKHAEDEISAANMACGASFTGTRVMVGTAGGGFCYMTEAVGLAGIAELPLVVVEAMRPGPALGMPTWTAQGDLGFILNASQDEFPRFVLAPGDGREAFLLARKAFELAEKYQTLVMLVSDKFLSESRHTVDIEETLFTNRRFGFADSPEPDESGFFPRYRAEPGGVSPRSVPGQSGGSYIANSYEHDNYGLATEEGSVRVSQMEKRFGKLDGMRQEVPEQLFESDPDAKLTFVSFGSTKGVIRAARRILSAEDIKTNMLHLSWIWPFPKEQVKSVLSDAANPVVVEGNFQGQLARLIAQETGIKLDKSLRRYDGRPFYVEDIVEYAKQQSH